MAHRRGTSKRQPDAMNALNGAAHSRLPAGRCYCTTRYDRDTPVPCADGRGSGGICLGQERIGMAVARVRERIQLEAFMKKADCSISAELACLFARSAEKACRAARMPIGARIPTARIRRSANQSARLISSMTVVTCVRLRGNGGVPDVPGKTESNGWILSPNVPNALCRDYDVGARSHHKQHVRGAQPS